MYEFNPWRYKIIYLIKIMNNENVNIAINATNLTSDKLSKSLNVVCNEESSLILNREIEMIVDIKHIKDSMKDNKNFNKYRTILINVLCFLILVGGILFQNSVALLMSMIFILINMLVYISTKYVFKHLETKYLNLERRIIKNDINKNKTIDYIE
jgi:hypothetical protein